MKKNLLLLLINSLLLIYSCGECKPQTNSGYDDNAARADYDSTSCMTDADYFNKVDEYVSSIRENIELASIEKTENANEKTVLFVMDNDTVKISVLTDTNACTDIYFQNSTPVFMSRDIILDVDSNYMETAYFKNGKIYMCFRDGVAINENDYLQQFVETLGDK